MSNPFQHIKLSLVKNAPQKKPKPRVIPKKQQTADNLLNRNSHYKNLENSRHLITQDWLHSTEKRQLDNLPEMPGALSIFLQLDTRDFSLEKLRAYGIEVIGEFEDGFIIGSSTEISLGTLAEKIKKFAAGSQHDVAGLWNIINGISWRFDRILSEELRKEWPFNPNHIFVVEVGVACMGMDDVPEHPSKRKKSYKTEEDYRKAVEKWETKRDAIYQKWDDLADTRYSQLMKVVNFYGGEDLSGYMEGEHNSETSLPDCFTLKIRINAKGLIDIVENYPYVFDISEADSIEYDISENSQEEVVSGNLTFKEPAEDAPAVCVIDSGIQERHPFLRSALDDSASRSWIGSSTDVADYVQNGGHGTSVAGAILYPRQVPKQGNVEFHCWIQNARILDGNNSMPASLFPPKVVREIVDHFYYGEKNTRIYNHSINSNHPSRIVHMSAWAAQLDQLSWEKDILFVVSAGNLPKSSRYRSLIRLSISEHVQNGRLYPDYLLESSSRIASPSQSLQAVTVGSIGLSELVGLYTSFSKENEPSSFSCTGPGIWNSIKPEVVEFGGCYAFDNGNPSNILLRDDLSPELVSSTLNGGATVRKDKVGTSFSTPKVSSILAHIQQAFPNESTLLYRALLIQSARWPNWASNRGDKNNVIRHIGYGIPDVIRSTENSPNRITLITTGDVQIKGKQVHIYEVKIPEELRRPGNSYDIRIDVTLSYKAQPRRTRRNRQRYLSTWLEWEVSKLDESSTSFASRMLEIASDDVSSDEDEFEEGSSKIKWSIGKQGNHGIVKGFHRNSGTVQKDWAIVKSYDLGEKFCLAVIGHLGWNKDINSSVPYALAVSFEDLDQTVEIYTQMALENQLEVEEELEIHF
ncbi:S8 family peptidase [Paenibacillus alginolyticus]|uniref:S8 family peptidase n=1 Tax=Paenibacillus alginolyticus TaxID=59839 RepID=UPI0004151C07|nr:S8 family peptidase [Paenibacillus alginolyticus]MCY9666697.1 S8 family peptidase [Paenibacillus alginolyticus]